MATKEGSKKPQLAGVVGFFDDADGLVTATRKTREAKFQHFDAFTPYPVHGLEEAQGLRRSPVPYVTFVAGITGTTLAFLFEYWTSAVDWPLNVGGKPFNSWPAFVPIMFELTVLIAGLSTFAAMLIFNGLPNVKRKTFDPGVTRDRFALVIEAPLPIEEDDSDAIEEQAKYKKFTESDAAQFLKSAGAMEVRSIYAEGWF